MFQNFLNIFFIIFKNVFSVIRENRTISKRALFYLYPGLFKTQALIDHAGRVSVILEILKLRQIRTTFLVDQLAFLIAADRPDLNVFQVKLFSRQGLTPNSGH